MSNALKYFFPSYINLNKVKAIQTRVCLWTIAVVSLFECGLNFSDIIGFD